MWIELDEFWQDSNHLLLTEPSEYGDKEPHVRHAPVVELTHTADQGFTGRCCLLERKENKSLRKMYLKWLYSYYFSISHLFYLI